MTLTLNFNVTSKMIMFCYCSKRLNVNDIWHRFCKSTRAVRLSNVQQIINVLDLNFQAHTFEISPSGIVDVHQKQTTEPPRATISFIRTQRNRLHIFSQFVGSPNRYFQGQTFRILVFSLQLENS